MAGASRRVLTPRPFTATDGIAGFVLVAVAALLRFQDLGRGLDHVPFWDEKVFVDSALQMVREGGLDHHFYEYPALLVWMMAAVFKVFSLGGPEAVLAGRTLCAIASTATVGIAYLALQRRMSRILAILATTLLVLSPVDVETPHAIRPDAVLAPFVLLSLLALAEPSRIYLGAFLVAVATAVKFSGALLVVPLAYALFIDKTPLRKVFAAAGILVVTFVLLSPYTLLAGTSSVSGMDTQLSYHYATEQNLSFAARLFDQFRFGLVKALSPFGLMFAIAGAGITWMSRREDRVLVVFAATWLAVFSTTSVRYERFLVPVLATLVIFAGVGIEAMHDRLSRTGALFGAVASVVISGSATAAYLAAIRAPTVPDRALEAIRKDGSIHRIYSELEGFAGGRPDSLEVLPRAAIAAVEAGGLRIVDAVVLKMPTDSGIDDGDLEGCERFSPATIFDDVGLRVCRTKSAPPVPLSYSAANIEASNDADRALNLVDGELSTKWRGEPGATLVFRFGGPMTLARIDVLFGRQRPPHELQIRVEDLSRADAPVTIAAIDGRVDTSIQSDNDPKDPGFSRVLLLKPVTVSALRLSFKGAEARIGEVRFFGPQPPK